MASLAAILRLDKINKKGESPVYFRIIKHRKVNYIASGVKLLEKYWDDKREKVKPNHPNSKRLNSYLTNKFNELQDKVFEYATEHRDFTTAKLKNAVLGKKPTNFWAFAESTREKYLAEGKIGTYDRTGSILKKLRKYVDNKELFFQDIDFMFIEKYETYLRTKLGNSTNTITSNFKFIKKLFNEAIKYDLIPTESNPFNKYKMKWEKTQRAYLTEEELKAIEDLPLELYSKIDRARDMYIFSAYAGGIRISDVLTLEQKDIQNGNALVNIQKTGGQISIKLPKVAADIVTKWENQSTRFVFPCFYDNFNLEDSKALDGGISRETASINKYLKQIASQAKIKKVLSFHISRHTWATRALRKGISIDKVSKLMGHSQIRETQIYARIVNEELDKAMGVFDE